MLYITTKKGDDEFTIAKLGSKEDAINCARQYWATLCPQDRKTNEIEIREYIEDVEDENCVCFDYNTIPWQIWAGNRENGDLIERCDSIQSAELLIEKWEEIDKENGEYTPNYYTIINENHEQIIE